MQRHLAIATLCASLLACGSRPPDPVTGCTTTRTVSGALTVTYWTESGRSSPSTDLAWTGAPVSALTRTASGYAAVTGTVQGDGTFSLPNVCADAQHDTWYLVQDGRTRGAYVFVREMSTWAPQINRDLVGRRDVAAATTSTPVTLDVTGLEPWEDGMLEVTSTGAGLYDPLLGPDSARTLEAGATSTAGQAPFDWSTAYIYALPDASQGDDLWIHQLQSRTVASGQPGAGLPYWSAVRYAHLTGVSFTSGAPATLSATLAPAPRTRAAELAIPVHSGWAALNAQMGAPEALGVVAEVVASPWSSSAPAPVESAVSYTPVAPGVVRHTGVVTPRLLQMGLRADVADLAGVPVEYGQFFDTRYHEVAVVAYLGQAQFQAEGTGVRPASLLVQSGKRVEMPTSGTVDLGPSISPPRSPTIGGLSLLAPQAGVTTTPLLQWSAPTTGTPTSYTLVIYRLGVSSLQTTFTRVLQAKLSQTLFLVPDGILASGGRYLATLTANMGGSWDLPDFGNDFAYPYSFATVVTQTFIP